MFEIIMLVSLLWIGLGHLLPENSPATKNTSNDQQKGPHRSIKQSGPHLRVALCPTAFSSSALNQAQSARQPAIVRGERV